MGVLFDPLDRLTPRQLQIMRRAYAGATATEISTELKICASTLRWHLMQIRQVFPTFRVWSLPRGVRLTEREREIALLVAQGMSNRAICAVLTLEPNTLRFFLKRLYRKTQTENRVELTRTILMVQNRIPIGATEAA